MARGREPRRSPPTSNVAIRGIATGQRAAYLQAGGAPAAAQGKQDNAKQDTAKQTKETPRGLTVAGEVKNYVPVTDAMLRNPDPADWLMIRRDYKAHSYSTLNQITAQNVYDLRLVWSWAMQEGGATGNQPAPIVHNGVLYVNNTGNVLQALDAKTGELIWENRYGTNAGAAAMRGITIYDDKVFVATNDAHLMAFDARNGKQVWDTTIGDRSKGEYSTTSGPIAVKGKLIQGLGACAIYRDEKCFISAYDAKDGKELWRFKTIALDGEPGGDTWGGLANLFRAGAETWITGSYDPDLNITYWGTAQSKPWMRVSRGSGNGATLFANSTVALNADTGKMVWYYNHAPGETLDLDEVFERVPWWTIRGKVTCSARARRAFCGSWTGRPENIWVTRRWFFRTCTIQSTRPRASRIIATTSWSSVSAIGCRGVLRLKAARTGRRCPTISRVTA